MLLVELIDGLFFSPLGHLPVAFVHKWKDFFFFLEKQAIIGCLRNNNLDFPSPSHGHDSFWFKKSTCGTKFNLCPPTRLPAIMSPSALP